MTNTGFDLGAYAKLAAPVVATLLGGLAAALLDNHVTPDEWVNIAIMVVGGVSVLVAANTGGIWDYSKVALAFAAAALVALNSALTGGVTMTEVIQIVLAGLAAVGVYATPNRT